MEKRLILVVGSGRSGTSLFASVLKTLGCHIPQPEIKPDESNPRGFAESAWVVNFHYRMLRRAGVHMVDARPSAWAKTAQVGLEASVEGELREWLTPELERPEPVVIKDPRLVWFLPLWDVVGSGLGAQISYATMLRPPQEAYKSRQTHYTGRRRPSSAVAGWVNTMLHAERATRGSNRAFPRYESLLDDWTQAVTQVSQDLNLPILETVTANQQRAVNQFIDPSLRRSPSTWEDTGVHPQVSKMADDVWALFDRLPSAGDAEREEIIEQLDRRRDEYVQFYEFVESVAESSIVRIQPLKKKDQQHPRAAQANRKGGKAGTNGFPQRVKRALPPGLKSRVKRLAGQFR